MPKIPALVLSGGGAKGSYQLGAVLYLVNDYFKDNPFSIISGTSIGAINGAMIAQNDIQRSHELWMQMSSKKDIVGKRLIGKFGLLLGADSWSNAKPLWKLIKKEIDIKKIRDRDVDYICAVYNIQSRNVSYIHAKDPYLQVNMVKKFILASASIPGEFPPVEIMGKRYLDGGVREITPIKPAIDLGADIIFIIRCSPSKLEPLSKMPSGISVLTSTLDSLVNEIYNEDIDKAMFINSFISSYRNMRDELLDNGYYENDAIKVASEELEKILCRFRFLDIIVLEPSTPAIGTLDINPEKIRHAITRGMMDMKKVMQDREKIEL